MDAVALAVKRDVFEIISKKNISLGSAGDRVALLILVKHNHSKKDMVVAATHLSFPHSAIDRISQMRQMRRLTSCIDNFAREHHVDHATRIVLGDFNVEGESPVCDHLRSEGYFSCSEITPPKNILQSTEESVLRQESGQNGTIPEDVKISRLGSLERKISLEEREERYYHLNETAPISRYTVKFVSHRTHRSEDLGVDHIFIKPEFEFVSVNSSSSAKSSVSDQAHESPDTSARDGLNKERMICSGGVFVDGTEIVPHNTPCQTWVNSFVVSDHRPFGACIVVGRKIPENLDFEI